MTCVPAAFFIDFRWRHGCRRAVFDIDFARWTASGGGRSRTASGGHDQQGKGIGERSEEHTSELQSLMRISYAVFCLKKNKNNYTPTSSHKHTLTIRQNT